jgi:hypothetical protein
MHRETRPANARRRRAIIAAVIGVLGVVASIAVALPASAAARQCVRARFGTACVTPVQHTDGAAFDGYVTDAVSDDESSVATIWGFIPQFNEWRDLFIFVAHRPEQPTTPIHEFVPGRVDWMLLELCRVNRVTRERQCHRTQPVHL